MSRTTLFAGILALALVAPAFAQDQGGRRNRGGDTAAGGAADSNNNNGNRGRYDPQQMMNELKTQMNATDDDWKVIEPKLQKVEDARREQMMAMFGGRFSRRSDSSTPDANASTIQTASKDLRDILDKKDATPEEITAKLTAFREARDKSKATLAAAQKDLKEVLTARQEAVLVSRGRLD